MNLYRLRIFLAVARRLSYSRAAEDLFISQPAVSRHVAALEKELGIQLFGQSGNKVLLTEMGRLVHGYAQKLFDVEEELTAALAETANLERGRLRLGASSTPGIYLLPPVVAAFQERYPAVEVSLLVANSQEVEARVLAGELDLGFVGASFQPGLQVLPYARDRLLIVATPSHPAASEAAIPLERLFSERFLLRERGSGTRSVLEEEFERRGFRPSRTLELAGCEAVKRGAMAGLGVAAVSEYSVDIELRQGLLKVLRVVGLLLERQISTISHKDVRPSAAALAFTALARKVRSGGMAADV
ncbi:MAG: LysR substrate-binding domain-containing protein [Chloroflexi bacterium]|nr:LysR substrate-binding domain-containing protein [Chloroflexota bacterium]